MIRVAPPLGAWRPARFWTVTAALFILQAGLIWSFAERTHKVMAPKTPEFTALLLARPMAQDQLATALFAGDPTLFQAPNRRGFSGAAWMETPPMEYHAGDGPARDVWLSMNSSGWKPSLASRSHRAEFSPTLSAPPSTVSPPSSLVPDANQAPSASTVRLEGPLARRRLLTSTAELPAQASAQLAANSIVQIAVDPAGQVLSACVISDGGLPGADAEALRRARSWRFAPQPSAPAVTWGNAVFSWQTIPPPAPGK
ncbi:MAG TPA: hypothetical protein VHB20_12780 [Verrucomicrobiae bacterium]|jgi:TonB family protein|nr:hypothetical protein [Verrucomicrobiae bacterium]